MTSNPIKRAVVDPPTARYYDFKTYLTRIFGTKVHRISLDAHLSCPNRDGTISTLGCIFCDDQGSGTGLAGRGLSLTEQIRTLKQGLNRRFKVSKFVAYFQSYTNTYAPLPRLRQLYDEALADPDIVGLFIGTRPDCVSPEVVALLAEYAETHLVWLELGLQSAHDRTLILINRGHTFADFVTTVTRLQGIGVQVCAHVILGLPGESAEDMMATAQHLSALPVAGVKIHLLYIVKGTALDQMYLRGEYQPLTRAAYVRLVGDFLSYLRPEMVVMRLTGDPPREFLRAPAWALEKQKNLADIKDDLVTRNLWQGKFCGAGFIGR
ncbi:MAG: TIGR01212 family radical SAM protein [Deltaproteobacteria bacterium]|nr:TIGR01212 family radical SAM protein [Deltaproteobacteria bacterium]